ncbi:MAG: hypothetical protein ABIJ37_03260 [Pseudomonadota bacterium]
MRDRIWNNLYNIKFKALYTCECSKIAERVGRFFSLFIALASAGSIATWAVWKEIPSVWASIIAVSQVLHITKHYIPFIKNDKSLLELSYEFESLYIEFEKLWYSLENEKITTDEAEQKFYELRNQALNIEKNHKEIHCPDFKSWKEKVNEATESAIKIHFSKGD